MTTSGHNYVIVETAKPFKKRFQKKSNEKQAAILSALDQLREDPRHSSLQTARFSGGPEWYARSSKGDRIFFLMKGNEITLTANCNHDMLRVRGG